MSRLLDLGLKLAIVFFSLWLHHMARVWMAGRCGDREAASRRLWSENAFARIDWIGSVLLPAFLIFRGQPVLGWTRPLELDAENLPRPRLDALRVALAGPAVNLLLALAGIGVFRGLNAAGLLTSPFLMQILPFFCLANACLAAFNLLPIPPLAASIAAEQFLGGDALSSFEDIKPFGFLLLLAGVYFNFFDFLTIPLGWLVNAMLGI